VLQVFAVAASQSVAKLLQPQEPATHTLLFVCVVQLVQLEPHDVFAVLSTHVDPLQQNPVAQTPAAPRIEQELGHVAGPPLTHRYGEHDGFPAPATTVQVPTFPALLHESHAPAHAVSQHTPSAQ
jgi:hypothetical protein